MLRRWLTPWLFALTLIFGQMGALAHAASHFTKQDKGLPDHVCELCLAHANLGGGAASTPLVIGIPDAVYHWTQPFPVCVTVSLPPVARARAPPAVV
jgi:hypothetical protein